ncbi:alpha/beta fold hydrolase [Dactylosporangium sp. NPDC000555]|uniref:thioesterase II family protein n=1 Tax=Dactylosporangium sp. NPDC000555 TaxID=3154260 RepID=UPI00331C134A
MTRSLPRPDAAFRLFCIPSAGAGATAFRGWPALLSERVDVEVLPICPPGREHRIAEAPQIDLDRLADGVEEWLDRPYGLYGHSVGARLAFELARELRRRGRRHPALLAVSGCPAPQLPVPTPEDSGLDDAAFLRRVIALGALPEVVLNDPELRELVLPPLRADFRYVDTYRYRPEPPLDLYLHALGGDRDPEASAEAIRAWRAQTVGPFRCSMLPGGHFFIHSEVSRVVAELATSIAGCLGHR